MLHIGSRYIFYIIIISLLFNYKEPSYFVFLKVKFTDFRERRKKISYTYRLTSSTGWSGGKSNRTLLCCCLEYCSIIARNALTVGSWSLPSASAWRNGLAASACDACRPNNLSLSCWNGILSSVVGVVPIKTKQEKY